MLMYWCGRIVALQIVITYNGIVGSTESDKNRTIRLDQYIGNSIRCYAFVNDLPKRDSGRAVRAFCCITN
jgi:hypothetical protein